MTKNPMPERRGADDPTPKVRAMFCLTGDNLDLGRVAELVGINATEQGRKGDKPHGRRFPVPETFWSLEVESRCHTINQPVSELLERIWPRREGVRRSLDETRAEATLVCAVTLFEDRADYSLSPETVARLAGLRAGFSLDVVDYSQPA